MDPSSSSTNPTCVDYCGSGPDDLFGAHTFDRSGVCSIFGLFLTHLEDGMDMDRYGWWLFGEGIPKQKKDKKKRVSVELAMFRLKLSICVWRGASTTRVSLISFACRGSKINSINETALIRTTLRGNFSWKITMFDGNTWNPKREVWNGWPAWYNYFAK